MFPRWINQKVEKIFYNLLLKTGLQFNTFWLFKREKITLLFCMSALSLLKFTLKSYNKFTYPVWPHEIKYSFSLFPCLSFSPTNLSQVSRPIQFLSYIFLFLILEQLWHNYFRMKLLSFFLNRDIALTPCILFLIKNISYFPGMFCIDFFPLHPYYF